MGLPECTGGRAIGGNAAFASFLFARSTNFGPPTAPSTFPPSARPSVGGRVFLSHCHCAPPPLRHSSPHPSGLPLRPLCPLCSTCLSLPRPRAVFPALSGDCRGECGGFLAMRSVSVRARDVRVCGRAVRGRAGCVCTCGQTACMGVACGIVRARVGRVGMKCAARGMRSFRACVTCS